MDVYEAVASRRAVRRFSGEPISRETLERVLSAAARSPSGANLQPWHVYVLTDAPLAELKKRTAERVTAGDPGDAREYQMYPPDLKSPYRDRRSAAAEQRYAALGIPHEDRRSREAAVAANWDCFGAPAALFCYIDRDMGPAQWADLGMYLQTVMLLLRAEGLHTCPQMAWSVYCRTVAEAVSPLPGLILFCGVSIGFEAPDACRDLIDRAPLAETVTFVGGRGVPAAGSVAGRDRRPSRSATDPLPEVDPPGFPDLRAARSAARDADPAMSAGTVGRPGRSHGREEGRTHSAHGSGILSSPPGSIALPPTAMATRATAGPPAALSRRIAPAGTMTA